MPKISMTIRFTVLLVVLIVALTVGSNVFSSHPQTNAERAMSLDTTIKCPSCEDLSVAQASSPSSLAIRAQVRRDVDKGMSNSVILAQLESQYGNAILLTPPPGGLSAILWIVPILLVLGAVVILVIVVRSRHQLRISRDRASEAVQ